MNFDVATDTISALHSPPETPTADKAPLVGFIFNSKMMLILLRQQTTKLKVVMKLTTKTMNSPNYAEENFPNLTKKPTDQLSN